MEPGETTTTREVANDAASASTSTSTSSEVRIPFEARSEEDALSIGFQQDLAALMTPVAVFLVIGMWMMNMKKGRVAAAAFDGVVSVVGGAVAARRARKEDHASER